MFTPLILAALLTGGAAAPASSSVSTGTVPTGSQILLTGPVITQAGANRGTGNAKAVYLIQPSLTDRRGQPIPAEPWLNTPLTVISQTAAAYTLSNGSTSVTLSKRNLAAKAVFPLVQDGETRALADEFLNRTGWPNGRLDGPCEIVPGYHADVDASRATVVGVWRVQVRGFPAGPGISLSPQGGLVWGDMVQGERVTASPIFVQFGQLQGVKTFSASMEPGLQDQSAKLMALAPQRCTALGVLQYASANDLRRSLRLVAAPAAPPREGNPDRAEKLLLSQTREQVLSIYGSPNEPGTLANILKLPHWSYGAGAYDDIQIDFGVDGRVSKVRIARSP